MLKKIRGTKNDDTLTGRSIPEYILGLDGNDSLFGNGGADKLSGGSGNDRLDGGAGIDRMIGGSGNDIYFVDDTLDKIKESAGGGKDKAIASQSYTLSANVEILVLDGKSDIDGTGNSSKNTLYGNKGSNILDGLQGGDVMKGYGGNDTYHVDNKGDRIVESANGGTSDTVIASVDFILGDNIENLTMIGLSDLSATGNGLKNIIVGNDGANRIDGGAGIDWMKGGLGDDIYYVDNSADKITENDLEGTDSVQSKVTYTLSAHVENLSLLGKGNINGTGNDEANIINGNDGANKLYADRTVDDGLGGLDALYGGNGNDTLYSGDGSNILDGGLGTDFADYSLFSTAITVTMDTFSASVDKTAGGTDTLTSIESVRGSKSGDTFNISIAGKFYGGLGNDVMSDSADDGIFGTLYGEGGNDTLSTGADGGNLDGGADDDILVVGASSSTVKTVLTGGTGADEFWLAVETAGGGLNGRMTAGVKVMDFQDGVDHLVFAAFGSIDTPEEWYALLQSANEITDDPEGLQIGSDTAPGDVILLGLRLADFSADDILVM